MNLTVSLFESHAKKYEEIVRHADDLFVVLEDKWLDIYLRQNKQEFEDQKPAWFGNIPWNEGKQVISCFTFDVLYERPVMIIKVATDCGSYHLPIEIDQEVIDMYSKLKIIDFTENDLMVIHSWLKEYAVNPEDVTPVTAKACYNGLLFSRAGFQNEHTYMDTLRESCLRYVQHFNI
jgi:hypothetical protein